MSEKWETVGNGSKAKQNGSSKAGKMNGTKNVKKEAKVYTMEEVGELFDYHDQSQSRV